MEAGLHPLAPLGPVRPLAVTLEANLEATDYPREDLLRPLGEDLEVMVLEAVEVQEASMEVPAETEIDFLDLLFQITLLDNLPVPVPDLYLTGHPKLDQDPLILVSFK